MSLNKTAITISIKIPNLKKETMRWWGIIKDSKDLSAILYDLYVEMLNSVGDKIDESKQGAD